VHESGLALFKRAATLRRKRLPATQSPAPPNTPPGKFRTCLSEVPGPMNGWMLYCLLITILVPSFVLKTFGILFR
jgi:chitin synthase